MLRLFALAHTLSALWFRAMSTIAADSLRSPEFASNLARALPRLLAPGALPEDWDPRATTYDLSRFDSDVAFAGRFAKAISEIVTEDVHEPARIRERLAAIGLPFD